MIFFDNALNLIKSEGKDQLINPKFMNKVAAMTNKTLHNEDWFSFNSNFEEDNQKKGDIVTRLEQNQKNKKALSKAKSIQKLSS